MGNKKKDLQLLMNKKGVSILKSSAAIRKNKQTRSSAKYNTIPIDFTEDEDHLLLGLVKVNGPKFHEFVQYFPQRSFHSIKNRYYKNLRSESEQDSEQPDSTQNNSQVSQMFEEIKEVPLCPEIQEILSSLLTSFNSMICQTIQQLS